MVSLYFSFFYLLVIFRLGDYFGLPSSPTHTNLVMMILTLKLPGLAFEINSAATAPADDTQGINSDALKKINFMDVIHYSFGYMGVLTGKVRCINIDAKLFNRCEESMYKLYLDFCRSILSLQDVLGFSAQTVFQLCRSMAAHLL